MITVVLRSEDLAAGIGVDGVGVDGVGGDGAGGAVGDRVEVTGAPHRHLFRARRLEAGAGLRVVDGRGLARWAVVERVERRLAVLSLGALAPDNEPAYRLRLEVAALRSERASWLVEKATEIGVRSIRFIATERTPRKYTPASLDRLRRVARAAVEQSHRSWLPEIAGVESWEAVTAAVGEIFRGPPGGDCFVLDPAAERSGNLRAGGGSGIVLVGPEGGWSRSEAGELERLGCEGVCLGPRTLRVETAAVAAAARLIL